VTDCRSYGEVSEAERIANSCPAPLESKLGRSAAAKSFLGGFALAALLQLFRCTHGGLHLGASSRDGPERLEYPDIHAASALKRGDGRRALTRIIVAAIR